jgi:ABC-type sugar transport system permease subunit
MLTKNEAEDALKLRRKYLFILSTLALIVILVAAGLVWSVRYYVPKNETFEQASQRCGRAPVIGISGSSIEGGTYNYYSAPANETNVLLSLYNPAEYTATDYPKARFFCSIEKAKKAGFSAHECCGLIVKDR